MAQIDTQTLAFTIIVCVCFLVSVSTFIHFVYAVNRTKLAGILRICSFLSLSGYNAHILLTLLLYIYDSVYMLLQHEHDDSRSLPYNSILCNMHTFNIIPFFVGKMCMYYFFLSLIHISFRGSFIAYQQKLLSSIAAGFTFVMLIIFAFHAYATYGNITAMHDVHSPQQCTNLTLSTFSVAIIYTGSCIDALWSLLCLALFYFKLRQLILTMHEVSASEMISARTRGRSHSNAKSTISKQKPPEFEPTSPRKTITFSNTNIPKSPITLVSETADQPNAKLPGKSISNSSKRVTFSIAIDENISTPPSATSTPNGASRDSDIVVLETNSSAISMFSIQPAMIETAIEEEDEDENLSIIYDEDEDDDGEIQQTAQTNFSILPMTKLQSATATASDLRAVESASDLKSKFSLQTALETTPNPNSNVQRTNDTKSASDGAVGAGQQKEKKERKTQQLVRIRNRSRSSSNVHMKQCLVEQFLPVLLKLSVLSFWCALSTVLLGFALWTVHPTLASCIDSTINALCVYLAFAFSKPLYNILCAPLYSCCRCRQIEGILDTMDAEEPVECITNE